MLSESISLCNCIPLRFYLIPVICASCAQWQMTTKRRLTLGPKRQVLSATHRTKAMENMFVAGEKKFVKVTHSQWEAERLPRPVRPGRPHGPRPMARVHNDEMLFAIALSLLLAAFFRNNSDNFQCCTRNCWQSLPQGKYNGKLGEGRALEGRGGRRASQFQGSRLRWLHKNKITQEIKLAQIRVQQKWTFFCNKNDCDSVVALDRRRG